MQGDTLAWFLMGAGLFTLIAAIANWEWFFNNWRARVVTNMLGREGARMLYAVLGVAMLGGGIVMMMGGFGARRAPGELPQFEARNHP